MRSLTATAIFAALALADPSAHAADLVIKFSHVVAEDTPKGQAALHFKNVVEQRLAGKVRVDVYPGAMLMDDESAIDGLRNDTIQMAAPSLSLLEPYSKAYQVFDLPFLFRDTDAIDRFQEGPAGEQLLGAMRGVGIEGLCFIHSGMKQLSADRALRLPSDARGKRFRIQPSSVIEAQFQALDAVPVRAPFTKVFHLLQTSSVDGQENTWTNIYSQRFHETQPYITETNHGSLEYILIVSRTFWSNLPDSVRDPLSAAAHEACEHGNSVAAVLNAQDRQKIIESRYSEVIALTAEQRAQWVDAMKPVWTRFEPLIRKEIIDAALAANNAP
jgi:C4-dicarboxylate-binding protein DctP